MLAADGKDNSAQRLAGQQSQPAQQTLCGLRQAHDVAAQLGQELGRGEVLFCSLPARQNPSWLSCDWRVLQALKAVAAAAGLVLELRDDRHFYTTVREFVAHAKARRSLRMEFFYREQRKRHGVRLNGPWLMPQYRLLNRFADDSYPMKSAPYTPMFE